MSNIVTETLQNLIELHRLEEQLDRARTGKTALQSQIDEVRAKLIPNILGHHDRMRARGKRSIAEVRNNVCSGCHMTVAIGILATLRRMEDIQICANCGRYLHLPVEAPPETPAPAKPARKKRAATPPPAA